MRGMLGSNVVAAPEADFPDASPKLPFPCRVVSALAGIAPRSISRVLEIVLIFRIIEFGEFQIEVSKEVGP